MQNLNYTATERIRVPRPVDRIGYFARIAANKRVLDLGAYDETSFDKKDKESWLHGRIASSAMYTLGVDASEKLPKEGIVTSDKSRIVKGSIFELAEIIGGDDYDIIIAGELIEHLPNTLAFFCYLKSIPSFQGKRFVLSTPNATCWSNIFLGPFGMENNDLNHLQVYSYKTLNTLFLRAGFQKWRFVPYNEKFPEMIMRSKGMLRGSVGLFQKFVNVCEFCWPMLSGGWIAEITI